MKMNLKILFTLLLVGNISGAFDEDLIGQFFSKKLCKLGTILNCNSKPESLKLVKSLMSRGFRLSSFNVDEVKNFSVEKVLAKDNSHLAVIVDGDCTNAESVMKEAADLKYFFETYHWLIVGSDYNKVMDKIKNVPLEINVDVTVALPSTDGDNKRVSSKWTLYDVYNPAFRHGGDFKIEEIGVYDAINKTYDVKLAGIKYYNRRNMSGVLFNSVMVIPENISITLEQYLASDKDRFNNTFTRFHSVTIENCQAFYNFNNNITMMHSWGYQQPNGEVDGMLKELKEHRIDFGNAPLMYRLYRAKLIDYGHGNWIMRSAFIFRHPKSTLSSSEIYLRPLVDKVWILTVVFIILLTITLHLIITRQTVLLHSNPEESDLADWSFLLLYGIGELCQQGYGLIPALVSGKIVTLTVLVFSFLIYQFYSASIVSLLLMEPPKTIKTLDDLVKSNLKAGCEDSLFDRDYLKKTTDPVAIQLFNSKIKQQQNQSNFYHPDVGLKKIVRGGYAFHAQTSTAYPIIENTFSEEVICSLAEVQMYPNEYLYMIIQKHSPFRELFNYCMFHQMEVGVIKRLRVFWNARKPFCLDPTNYLEISVGIKESYWGLMLLGCGYLLSFIFLGLEFVWSKKNKIKKLNIFKKAKNLNRFRLDVEPYRH